MSDLERRTLPRIMFAAAGSGQGKTTVVCGLLRLLSGSGEKVCSFKCGPDYIDPMFHSEVLHVPSYNLDSFFADRNTLRYLMARHGHSLALIEGVMGYYDGLFGVQARASSYEVAKMTDTPVILIVDASGSGVSALAVLEGFCRFKKNSRIRGVFFNRLAPSLYPELKEQAEKRLGIRAVGYVPKLDGFHWESRHLGLIRPEELPKFNEDLDRLAACMRETVDLTAVMELAQGAAELTFRPFAIPCVKKEQGGPVIAVARDEAFCFYYRDNLELLEEMGARLLYFSPLRDRQLPEEANGLYLGGGYPELCAKELAKNASMRESVRAALAGGLPCIAECGGYLYLKETLEDTDKIAYPMVGFLPGRGYPAGKLARFGYMSLRPNRDSLLGGAGSELSAHEFHYWDSAESGDALTAVKVSNGSEFSCGYAGTSFYAGFPHLYFYGDMKVPYHFLREAAVWKKDRQ